jgi:hypothetical protein
MYYLEYAPKNNIEPKVYKNFFSNEELEKINQCINDSKKLEYGTSLYAPVIQKELSRVHIELVYPEDILKRVEEFASELCGEPVVMTHNSYYHYDKNYNTEVETPTLRPHRDFDNYYSKLTLDYQLDKTVDWDIIIEGDRYNLEVGDMLAFWGAGVIHWRENIVLQENETTTVLTLHFSNKEDHEKLNEVARDNEERVRRHNINMQDENLQNYKKIWEQERVDFNNRKNGV